MNVARILDMIERLFTDTSVPPEVTLDRLREIQEKVDTFIDVLEQDLAQ